MEITINNTQYTIKWTLRSFFLFEQITGKMFKMETMTDEYIFIYCLLLANNPDVQLTFDEFINVCDEDIKVLATIRDYIAKEMQKRMLFQIEDNSDSKKKN